MVRYFRLLISALLLSSSECARVDGAEGSKLEEAENQVWNFNGLALNPDPNGPLIPGLVPPPGTAFNVVNKEVELGLGHSQNNYRWAFLSIDQGGNAIPVNEWFASINGEGFFGFFNGRRRTVVRNNLGVELFVIEAARVTTTTSWRIRHPVTNQILFTINKDWFGTGFLGLRDEWRIYRGRQRDAQQLYYVVADYSSHRHRFYHSRAEYKRSATPAASTSNYSPGGIYTQGFISDSIGANVQAGEDTALILSTTIVVDMLNEVRAANARHQAALREEERRTGHRRRRGVSDNRGHVSVGGGGGGGVTIHVSGGGSRRRGASVRRRRTATVRISGGGAARRRRSGTTRTTTTVTRMGRTTRTTTVRRMGNRVTRTTTVTRRMGGMRMGGMRMGGMRMGSNRRRA